MESTLSMKERELIAVGASVAGGCVPCTEYHLKAVQTEGATTDEIVRAIDIALCVKDGSKHVMRRLADGILATDAFRHASCCELREEGPSRRGQADDRMAQLISVAAAVAVSCPESFFRHTAAARESGASEHEIELAVGFARMIRARASEKMDLASAHLAGGSAAPAGCGPNPSSGNDGRAVKGRNASAGSASGGTPGCGCA